MRFSDDILPMSAQSLPIPEYASAMPNDLRKLAYVALCAPATTLFILSGGMLLFATPLILMGCLMSMGENSAPTTSSVLGAGMLFIVFEGPLILLPIASILLLRQKGYTFARAVLALATVGFGISIIGLPVSFVCLWAISRMSMTQVKAAFS